MVRKKTTEDLVRERPTHAQLKAQPRTPLIVIADNLRSLDNVGLLFRLCELVRAEHLYLTGFTGYPGQSERHTRRINKTAVYSVAHQPWSHYADPAPLVNELKQKGYRILALEQTDQSVPYHQLPVTSYELPVTLILGHEREGIRPELLEIADDIIDIPILGLGNSHNVAIAAGIVLYHILEKTGKLGSPAPP